MRMLRARTATIESCTFPSLVYNLYSEPHYNKWHLVPASQICIYGLFWLWYLKLRTIYSHRDITIIHIFLELRHFFRCCWIYDCDTAWNCSNIFSSLLQVHAHTRQRRQHWKKQHTEQRGGGEYKKSLKSACNENLKLFTMIDLFLRAKLKVNLLARFARVYL